MNAPSAASQTVILVTNDGMGKSDPELQHKLIAKYFQLLLDDHKLPAAICFYADGVRLVCSGSPVIEVLRELQAQGVHLVVCNTCLNHLGLVDDVQVGMVGGMGDIIEAQWQAEKVITL
ncbi:MAG: sulfurtransferase-like selenium metabolism protein YedF [Chloroflexi bacterium]|nr:sulfurtransferase-like selenium metabolism protein YedF [Chloroflexota bacterium]